MSTLTVRTDGGEATELATPLQLFALLHDAAEFVVVERPGARAHAAVLQGRAWLVEVVEVPTSRHGVRADVPNTDATYDLLRSWCNGDDWWADAFGWRQFVR